MLRATFILCLSLVVFGSITTPSLAGDRARLTQRETLELWLALEAGGQGAATALAKAAVELHLPPQAVRQFFAAMKDAHTPLIESDRMLATMIARYRRLLAEPATAVLAEGDFRQVSMSLAEAEQRAPDPGAKAALRSLRGEIALLGLDYGSAAEHFRAALALAPPGRAEPRAYRILLAGTLRARGLEERDSNALLAAIEGYLGEANDVLRAEDPQLWVVMQDGVGLSLVALGDLRLSQGRREEAEKCFERAVAAHRLALEEATRERDRQVRSDVQEHLVRALHSLALRQHWSGYRGGSLGYGTHVALQALQERIGEWEPRDWAALMVNFGDILSVSRDWGGMNAMAYRSQADDAYRMTLDVYVRQHEPWDWARVQEKIADLAHSYGRFGHRHLMTEAVAGYDQALEEFTRERAPEAWRRLSEKRSVAAAYLQ